MGLKRQHGEGVAWSFNDIICSSVKICDVDCIVSNDSILVLGQWRTPCDVHRCGGGGFHMGACGRATRCYAHRERYMEEGLLQCYDTTITHHLQGVGMKLVDCMDLQLL